MPSVIHFQRTQQKKKVVSSCSDSNISHSSDSHGVTCVCVCGVGDDTLYISAYSCPSETLQLVSYEGPVSLCGSLFMSYSPEVLQGRVSLSEGEAGPWLVAQQQDTGG